MSRDWESLEEIELAFAGIFDRLARVEEEDRSAVLWALSSRWCMGCGKSIADCVEDKDACCDTPGVEVTAKICPTCEMIRWSTVRRTDGVPLRNYAPTPNSASQNPLPPKET